MSESAPQHSPLQIQTLSDPAQVSPCRRKIEAYAASLGFDDRACGEIGLCFNEALANVIRHAYGSAIDKPVVITASEDATADDAHPPASAEHHTHHDHHFDADGNKVCGCEASRCAASESAGTPAGADAPKQASPPRPLRITIRDWGNGRKPPAVESAKHDPLRPGGLGLVCLASLMDQITFTPQAQGMLLTLVRKDNVAPMCRGLAPKARRG